MDCFPLRYSAGAWKGPLPDLDRVEILALAFGSGGYETDTTPFDDLNAKYPNLQMVGCSSAGEILGDEISDDDLVVMLVVFEHTSFSVANVEVGSPADSMAAGERLVSELSGEDVRGVIVFSDGLGVNGSELAQGFNNVVSPSVVICGGLAGDGDKFEETWVLVDGKPRSGYVTAVALYGDDVELAYGSAGGWRPFGPVREITKSNGNVLYQLDGRPALALYKEYLGERSKGLPSTALLFPLQVSDQNEERSLVRTVLSVDEETNSMTFAGDIPQGSTAQLMRASFDALVDGAEDAAKQTAVTSPSLCVAVSCVGRRLVLGEDSEEEVAATFAQLPPSSHQIGFYSYGELAPTGFQPCDLHNQTMTVTTISEN